MGHGGWWVWSWPSASRARARCPCPRTWMVVRTSSPPADPSQGCTTRLRHISCPSRPKAPTSCHGFPQSTQPRNSSLSLLQMLHENPLYIFLASVHLGLVLRSASLSLSVHQDALLFANHHLALSVGICWNTEVEPAHGEELGTRRATKCWIERQESQLGCQRTALLLCFDESAD